MTIRKKLSAEPDHDPRDETSEMSSAQRRHPAHYDVDKKKDPAMPGLSEDAVNEMLLKKLKNRLSLLVGLREHSRRRLEQDLVGHVAHRLVCHVGVTDL